MTTSEYKKYLDEITRQLKIIFEYNPFLNLTDKRKMATQEYIYNRYKVKLKPEQLARLNNLLEKQEERITTNYHKKRRHQKRKQLSEKTIKTIYRKVNKEVKEYNNAVEEIKRLKEELKNPMNEEQEETIKRQVKTLNAYIKTEQNKIIDEEYKKPLKIRKIQADIIDPLNAYNIRHHNKKIDPYKIICII